MRLMRTVSEEFAVVDVDRSEAAEHDTINTVTICVRQYVIYPNNNVLLSRAMSGQISTHSAIYLRIRQFEHRLMPEKQAHQFHTPGVLRTRNLYLLRALRRRIIALNSERINLQSGSMKDRNTAYLYHRSPQTTIPHIGWCYTHRCTHLR